MNKIDKLYFSALKTAAKAARSKSSGKRIPSGERWGVQHTAREKVTRRSWPIKDTYDKGVNWRDRARGNPPIPNKIIDVPYSDFYL